MRNPTRRLIYTLGLGWIAFVALGLGLRQLLASPKVTVVIDRSYCAPAQWQQRVSDRYASLYAQQEQREITIDQVIYVSDLGQEVAATVPSPEQVQALSTYGRSNPAQMQQATQENPDATVLSCGN
ncbi:hypothetical protein IQ265_15160 [Nodosilinea sp. LEGE 06152]|uniref:hypothetical protein n=1 Tax=Nodosilinea sp. LEGE 06152 TaxID=2777966 RepID=UPI00187F3326|nr:hypothetical protein [Nodosilinea sp. LEGE 06152]MBE9158156.1 hypothetical protein [Nodosilinea sp. LEGE 06152]